MKTFYIFALLVVFVSLLVSCTADDSHDFVPHANLLDNVTIKKDTTKDKDWDTIKIK